MEKTMYLLLGLSTSFILAYALQIISRWFSLKKFLRQIRKNIDIVLNEIDMVFLNNYWTYLISEIINKNDYLNEVLDYDFNKIKDYKGLFIRVVNDLFKTNTIGLKVDMEVLNSSLKSFVIEPRFNRKIYSKFHLVEYLGDFLFRKRDSLIQTSNIKPGARESLAAVMAKKLKIPYLIAQDFKLTSRYMTKAKGWLIPILLLNKSSLDKEKTRFSKHVKNVLEELLNEVS